MENTTLVEPNIGGDLNGNENSGGLSRWVVYAIIGVVAAIIIAAAVVYTRKRIQESREDGSIIKDIGGAITSGVDKKVVDTLLEVAIRAQTESAQLSADMETAKKLSELGQVSQADVDKAVSAADLSKTVAIQKNAEAAKALEAFRKKELSSANAIVLEATKKATGLSQEYEKVSDGITAQKVSEANALLLELVKKRQQAEADYNDALDTKNKAEAVFLESKKSRAENKRGIIAIMNKKIADLKDKIQRAKITKPTPPAPKPPMPAPKPPMPAPKPPMPAPAPKPAPAPSNVISTLDLRSVMKGGGSWNIKKYNFKKSNLTQFQGNDVIRSWFDRKSGTSKDPGVGGFSFEAIPNGMNRDAITFSWEVYYPRGFQFAKGGKFGGVHVGYGAASGGNFSTTGASNRVMWQTDGGAIAYIYPPLGLWQTVKGLDSKGYGSGFFNKELAKTLKTDSWNSISLGTKLNTFKNGVPQADGESYVSVNGNKQLLRGINWRKSEDLKISSFDMGVFFGGPIPSPVDQFCYFKNFQMSNY